MAKSNQFDAMVSYFNSLLTDAPTPKVQDKKVPNAARPTLDVDKEQESKTATLERLIAHVKPAEEALETKVLPEVKTQIQTEVETKVESNVETQVETQTELQTKTQDEVAATIRVDTKVQEEAAQASSAPQAPAWQNLETDNQFSALFFRVGGITLAVPLMHLGGIYEPGKINKLFGKPFWFEGVITIHEKQVSVVDTFKWMMPDKDIEEKKYPYVIVLADSPWCIECDELVGTKNIARSDVKWRESPGARPWLAGIVSGDMCALLHVEELVKLFNKGVNIKEVS